MTCTRRDNRLIGSCPNTDRGCGSPVVKSGLDWITTEWNQVIFSDKSRLNLSSDDNRVHVRRSRGELLSPAFSLQQHIIPTASVMSAILKAFIDIKEEQMMANIEFDLIDLILTSHCSATRGLLATDHVILNHGQVTWTTPELAPPLLTTTPHQREDISALDRFNVLRCPTRRVFGGTGLELVTREQQLHSREIRNPSVQMTSFSRMCFHSGQGSQEPFFNKAMLVNTQQGCPKTASATFYDLLVPQICHQSCISGIIWDSELYNL
ncbi:uncharacterized protein TNCV_561231 [Trichonephila clavipes]|uniref:Uncharacterized protein n=1 Tax=Trichonephila clavipes TaxID=2585209 RepID=A0A8X6S215_TRICX|nr:uncharacterized protein TNCV_561231 [Trichonephila clavipes]